MKKFKCLLLAAAAACALAGPAAAQDTNALKTQIGVFEARTGTVIVKGIGPVGSIQLGEAQLSVGCKQSKDINTGEKIYGLVIELEGAQITPEGALVDDSEISSLLEAAGYLARATSGITALDGFEATYTTKAGLQVVAECVRKDGGVATYLRLGDYPRIALSPAQMTQFYNLIQEGRKDVNVLKLAK
jgi:hypothetical protein